MTHPVKTLLTLLLVCTLAPAHLNAQPASETQDGLPLTFVEDFEAEFNRWIFTDSDAWERVDDRGGTVLAVNGKSDYSPPVRSPRNLAITSDLWVSDFILETKLRSTSRPYGHRDMVIVFGYQDASHYYYAHLAPEPDPHAHSIFKVDGSPRVSIADERSDGVTWEDGEYHTVRIERDVDSGKIRVYFDDMSSPVITATDTTFKEGRIGVGSFDDPGRIDDLQVWGYRKVDPKLTDKEILSLYDGLFVADVSDGMDAFGLRDQGLVDPSYRPLWRDMSDFSHKFQGIAVTVRYVPTNKPTPNLMSPAEFDAWVSNWYGNLSPEPFSQYIDSGSVVVIDGRGDGDTGTMGSNNGLGWVEDGAHGVVTSGGVRDTDEIIKQQIPVYLDPDHIGRGIRPGRNEIESVQEPVVIGGVTVEPGDVIVADNDGVIVVPREYAVPVARYARDILESRTEGRRQLYKRLNIPFDHSVK